MFGVFHNDKRGVAAVEFAFGSLVLVIGLLNAIDVGYYAYQRMEVENAAQVGAQAAWSTCYDPSSMLPATENCSGLSSAITTAIQSTSLGSSVALSSGYPTEGYYCATSSGSLQSVGSVNSNPGNCSATGYSSVAPGDYLQVEVTYSYAAMFPRFSVIGLLGISAISATSWMRLG